MPEKGRLLFYLIQTPVIWWLLISTIPSTVLAGDCQSALAKVVSIQGVVEVRTPGSQTWKAVQQDDGFCAGDQLRVRANSRAGLYLSNETFLRLSEQTSIQFSGQTEEPSTWLELVRGIAHFMSRVKHSFEIRTAYVNATIDGTEFTVFVDEESTQVTVMEGVVIAQNDFGSISLTDGQSAQANSGKAPVLQLKVRPSDAVQWALYYPSVLSFDSDEMQGALGRSIEAYRRGDMSQAFSALSDIDGKQQDANFYTYRATLNLSVGRIENAQADIDQSLKLQTDNADALALISIIATVQNEADTALELAQQAIAADKNAAGPRIAQSYALQARFEMDQARQAVMKATELEPNNALAWARLAELQLMFQNLDAAVKASQRAVEIDSGTALTQISQGFVNLIYIDIETAKAHFRQAMILDQAAPLPRLGLGVALIREGDLAAGRQLIETAANLDPGNALIRSYLGKAFYEEKRGVDAAKQLTLAKILDSNDPTAWYYDAIRKQSENRPIDALDDLQTSISLNDNRAVYRSRLLLDQDEAARNASQARIYNNLGFQQRGLLEGWKSVNTDPSNHSGHRLLADTYAALPRHEVARVSELLQSQLLQPLNTNPIQPQLAEANLGILSGSGPSSLSATEFNPMFTRNGIGVQFDGVVGGNSTLGSDLIISGLHDRVSYSLGQFHYETDGFRENNDLTQNIYNLFIQGSLSPSTSIQAEYRYRDADHGDLTFTFDPDIFSPVERSERRRNTGRLGLNHRFSPNGQLLASVIYQNSHIKRNETLIEHFEFPPATFESTDIDTIDSEGYTAELQYLGRAWAVNYVAGVGRFDEDRHDTEFVNKIFTAPLLLPEPDVITDFNSLDINTSYNSGYIYTYLKLSEEITLTLGVSFDELESSDIARDELNPKLGVMWKGVHGTTLRAAYFEGIARPLNAEQTIEPTQVAGFNQFFDDLAGSDTKRYGIALEQRFNPNVFSGIELTWRDLEAIGITTFNVERFTLQDDRKEQLHRAYVYWTPTRQLAFSTEYFYEEEDGEQLIPFKLVTQRAPISLSYFWPTGGFINGMATYVNQEFSGLDGTADDQFWIADLAIGYRLPRRQGILQLVVKNMLDEQFNFFDPSFRALAREPRGPLFAPETQVFVQFNLSFR